MLSQLERMQQHSEGFRPYFIDALARMI